MSEGNQRGQDGQEIALEARETVGEKLFSPSVGRNKAALADAFLSLCPHATEVLEIASGTGEHAAHICQQKENLRWQPSDPDPVSRASIVAFADDVSGGRMGAPLNIRTDLENWWKELHHSPDTLFCCNMIHIAPFTAAQGLFAGAGEILDLGGTLFLYGPFSRNGEMSESNHAFHQSLQARDPLWGVRDLDTQLVPLAQAHGLQLERLKEMPANNLSVAFRKTSSGS